MNHDFPNHPSVDDQHGTDNSFDLAGIVDQLTRRILDGESFDAASVARKFPAYADELVELLPAIQAVAALSSPSSHSSEFQFGTSPISRTLGDFRIVREIGRGGMGIVYEAEQISLGRQVAVKVLPYTGMLNDTQLQRFKNEARAAASLHHPNIVNAFFVGQERGVHFYAMRYVDGKTLAEIIADFPDRPRDTHENVSGEEPASESIETKPIAALSSQRDTDRREFYRTVARLGVQAADALDCAHSLGIVHRDIKPSNLMVDHDAHLWVTDFGLASTHTAANLTLTGDLLGTIRYMSPEQASGEANADARSDIYALGVTLYELLTLRPALDGESRVELLKQLEDREPTSPRTIDGTVPRDLENVILKSMAKSPSLRYNSAAELKDDLTRFIANRPVKARRITKTQMAIRWVQRRPRQAMMLAAVLCLLLVLSIGGPWMAVNQQQANRELLKQHYRQSVALAYENWRQYRGLRAQRELEDVAAPEYDELRGFAYDHLSGRLRQTLRQPKKTHPRPINASLLVDDDQTVITVGFDGQVRFLSSDQMRIQKAFRIHEEGVVASDLSPDKKWLVTNRSTDREIVVWSIESMTKESTLGIDSKKVEQLKFAPNGEYLFAATSVPNQLIMCDFDNGKIGKKVVSSNTLTAIKGIAVAPDSSTIVTHQTKGGCTVRSVVGGHLETVQRLPTRTAFVTAAAFSNDGRYLATVGENTELWRTSDWSRQIIAKNTQSRAVTFTEDGQFLITGGVDPIAVWDVRTRRRVATMISPVDPVESISQCSVDGSLIVTGCSCENERDTVCKLPFAVPNVESDATAETSWRPLTFCDANIDDNHRDLPHLLFAKSPRDSDLLPEPSKLELVNIQTSERETLDSSNRIYMSMTTHPSQRNMVMVGGYTGNAGKNIPFAELWDVAERQMVWLLPTSDNGYCSVAFSKSGKLFAVSTSFGTDWKIEIWQYSTRTRQVEIADFNTVSLTFSPDDRFLLASGWDGDGVCRIFDVKTGGKVFDLPMHALGMRATFSPSGEYFAINGLTGEVRIHHWNDKSIVVDQRRNRMDYSGFAFLGDDRTFAVSTGLEIELWRVDLDQHKVGKRRTGQLVGTLPTPAHATGLAFHNSTLAAVGRDARVMLWHRDGRYREIPPSNEK